MIRCDWFKLSHHSELLAQQYSEFKIGFKNIKKKNQHLCHDLKFEHLIFIVFFIFLILKNPLYQVMCWFTVGQLIHLNLFFFLFV